MKSIGMRIASAALMAAALSGCMWGRLQVNDPAIVKRAAYIRPGVTKVGQLNQILDAQPTMRIPGKKSNLYAYTFADTKTHGLVLIVVNFTRTETVTETLYVEADPETQVVTAVHVPEKRELEWRFWPFGEE